VRAALLLAAALCFTSPAAFAQSSPAPGSTDVTGHLPSGTWLLVVVALVLAGYISYRLGHKVATDTRRREGPISRALNEPQSREHL
jgi:hypothetical protein